MERKDTSRREVPGLGIFETFKTKNGVLTGAALRQRGILDALASGPPEERTRTAISKHVVGSNTRWKNAYSGIFQDIDSVLVPLGLVEEAGRIPPKRGPKALQESGIPYYHLTRRGRLVELATGGRKHLAKRITAAFSGAGGSEAKAAKSLAILAGFAPALAESILRSYVSAYCDGRVDLLPMTVEKIAAINDDDMRAHAEFLEGALSLKKSECERVIELLRSAVDKH